VLQAQEYLDAEFMTCFEFGVRSSTVSVHLDNQNERNCLSSKRLQNTQKDRLHRLMKVS